MHAERKIIQVHVDKYTRICLTLIVVLLAVLIVGLWADAPDTTAPATAAKPLFNPSKMTEQIQTNTGRTNEKLTELIGLFTSGRAKVQVAAESKKKVGGGKNVGK